MSRKKNDDEPDPETLGDASARARSARMEADPSEALVEGEETAGPPSKVLLKGRPKSKAHLKALSLRRRKSK